VDSAAARVVLHRSAYSRGYKLSREGADPMSLLRGGACVLVFIPSSPCMSVPASHFIVSKERTQVTFVVKKTK
jgi:hypothetical protein